MASVVLPAEEVDAASLFRREPSNASGTRQSGAAPYTMPPQRANSLPGIGFEGKSDLIAVMRALAE
jgi:hypothetical protein